jgi:hypothetical protein
LRGEALTRQELVNLLFQVKEEMQDEVAGDKLESLTVAEHIAKTGKDKQLQAAAGNILAGFVGWTLSFGAGDWTARGTGNPWAALEIGGLVAAFGEPAGGAVRNQGALWSSPSHLDALKLIHLRSEHRTLRLAGKREAAQAKKVELDKHVAAITKKYGGPNGAYATSFIVNELPFAWFTACYLANTAATLYGGYAASSPPAWGLKIAFGLMASALTQYTSHHLRARYEPASALLQGNTVGAAEEKVELLKREKEALEYLNGEQPGNFGAISSLYTNSQQVNPKIAAALEERTAELAKAETALAEARESSGIARTASGFFQALGTNAANNFTQLKDDGTREFSPTNTGRFIAKSIAMTVALVPTIACSYAVQTASHHLNTTEAKLHDPANLAWNFASPVVLIFCVPPLGWAYRYVAGYRAAMFAGSTGSGLLQRAFAKRERVPMDEEAANVNQDEDSVVATDDGGYSAAPDSDESESGDEESGVDVSDGSHTSSVSTPSSSSGSGSESESGFDG